MSLPVYDACGTTALPQGKERQRLAEAARAVSGLYAEILETAERYASALPAGTALDAVMEEIECLRETRREHDTLAAMWRGAPRSNGSDRR